MIVRPAQRIEGDIRIPGDKSISHRAAVIASLADGITLIENFSSAADCSSTLKVMERLGVSVERSESAVKIKGVGLRGFRAPAGVLDCGNSGTTMRLLAGILAGQPFESVLVGDASLEGRPMGRVIEPLELMGASISSVEGHAPLKVRGGGLRAVEYRSPIASAQIKSCVLLAGLYASGETAVIEPTLTRDHTERMLRWFGADVSSDGVRHTVRGDSMLTAHDLVVPADISSAAFFAAAAACLNGSEIRMSGVGLNPGRRGFIDVMRRLGARIEISNEREECNEPVGNIVVHGGMGGTVTAEPYRVSGAMVADIIDEIPMIAVVGTQLEGGLEVRDAAELRVKESDRISATVHNLRRMGAEVDEFPDGFRVRRSQLRGSVVDSFGDHRIAMAFAVAGLLAAGETHIEDAGCASVSFPGFFEVLDRAAQR